MGGKIKETNYRAVAIVPNELKDRALVVAEKEKRSLSNLIVKALDEYVGKREGVYHSGT